MKRKLLPLAGIFLLQFLCIYSSYGQGIGLVDIRQAGQVITVGGPEADLPAFTSQAIQTALDALKRGRRNSKAESRNL